MLRYSMAAVMLPVIGSIFAGVLARQRRLLCRAGEDDKEVQNR